MFHSFLDYHIEKDRKVATMWVKFEIMTHENTFTTRFLVTKKKKKQYPIKIR